MKAKECMVFDALIFYDSGKRDRLDINLVSKDVDKLRETMKVITGAKDVKLRYEEVDNLESNKIVNHE